VVVRTEAARTEAVGTAADIEAGRIEAGRIEAERTEAERTEAERTEAGWQGIESVWPLGQDRRIQQAKRPHNRALRRRDFGPGWRRKDLRRRDLRYREAHHKPDSE